MRPRIATTCSSAWSWVIFSFLTRDPVWIFETSSAFVRPWSTNFWSMSFRTTGMPAELMTWAISPPIVPAPTTAALKTNMGARLQRSLFSRFRGKAEKCAPEGVGERPANEQQVGEPAQRAALLELVRELDGDVGPLALGVERHRLGADQLVLEDRGHDRVRRDLADALGHAPATRRPGL